jgi:hypothetical protein
MIVGNRHQSPWCEWLCNDANVGRATAVVARHGVSLIAVVDEDRDHPPIGGVADEGIETSFTG